mmetsp:Transcript_9533/g.20212  ORF Transcript_9533/g.20212 Transcript_9533/m.20212 type:complete len:481 (+) Transcript_9533:452-1894(+)
MKVLFNDFRVGASSVITRQTCPATAEVKAFIVRSLCSWSSLAICASLLSLFFCMAGKVTVSCNSPPAAIGASGSVKNVMSLSGRGPPIASKLRIKDAGGVPNVMCRATVLPSGFAPSLPVNLGKSGALADFPMPGLEGDSFTSRSSFTFLATTFIKAVGFLLRAEPSKQTNDPLAISWETGRLTSSLLNPPFGSKGSGKSSSRSRSGLIRRRSSSCLCNRSDSNRAKDRASRLTLLRWERFVVSKCFQCAVFSNTASRTSPTILDTWLNADVSATKTRLSSAAMQVKEALCSNTSKSRSFNRSSSPITAPGASRLRSTNLLRRCRSWRIVFRLGCSSWWRILPRAMCALLAYSICRDSSENSTSSRSSEGSGGGKAASSLRTRSVNDPDRTMYIRLNCAPCCTTTAPFGTRSNCSIQDNSWRIFANFFSFIVAFTCSVTRCDINHSADSSACCWWNGIKVFVYCGRSRRSTVVAVAASTA